MPPAEAFAELTRAVAASLATYSNVHRGSGHHSLASTRLYEQARTVVLEHLGLREGDHLVVFCTPRRAAHLTAQLPPGAHHRVSSADLGLPLGVTALAIERRSLPRAIPFLTGGGTARLVSNGWIVWARPPDRFEAGTPAIVNVIAMAKALTLVRRFGPGAFRSIPNEPRHDALCGLQGSELLAVLRRTLIGLGATVPTVDGPRPFVNLDNAASTPTFAPIWDAVRSAWSQPPDVQQSLVREARSVCARFLGAPPDGYDVIFTSNTTEAVNLVAESLSK